MYDDADEVGNNGDNNGEPMEESWFWSELLPGTLTKSIIHNKYEYHRNKGFNVTIQKKIMIKSFNFFLFLARVAQALEMVKNLCS